MIITGWFVGFVALGIIPVLLTDGEILWWWLGGALLLAILDALLAPSPRKLRIDRRLPAKLRLEESGTSEVFLTNLSRKKLHLVVRDAWQPTAHATPHRQRLTLPKRERRKLTWKITPSRRGIIRSNFLTIRSYGPLRMAARQVNLVSVGNTKVLPAFRARKHLPSRLAKLREIDGQSVVMLRGQGTEFDSLRDYVRGDDVRSIDWRSTARRQEVTVRTWRPERDRRVVLVVDTGRTSAARIENETRLDTYFESALLLAALTSHAGDHTQLFGYDRRLRFRVAGMSGPEQLGKIMDSIAEVEPDLIETDWNAVPAQVAKLTTNKSLVVIFTTAENLGSSRGLMTVLPQLTTKHTVLVASVTDPGTFAATQDRSDRDTVYLAAAAEKALLDQERLTQAIKRLGAAVIRATPEKLPPAVADHYISLKAAGKL